MSTPHHSNAWAESYPEAHTENVAQIEEALREYEAQFEQAQAAVEADKLSPEESVQVNALYEDYQRLLQEYDQLTGKS